MRNTSDSNEVFQLDDHLVVVDLEWSTGRVRDYANKKGSVLVCDLWTNFSFSCMTPQFRKHKETTGRRDNGQQRHRKLTYHLTREPHTYTFTIRAPTTTNRWTTASTPQPHTKPWKLNTLLLATQTKTWGKKTPSHYEVGGAQGRPRNRSHLRINEINICRGREGRREIARSDH